MKTLLSYGSARRARFAKALAGAALLAGIPASAEAAFILRDYRTAGDKLIVYDDQTGLEWLRFSVTMGRSLNAARAENPEFTVAFQPQVTTLFQNFGLTGIGTGQVVAANLEPGKQFDYFFGNSSSSFGGAIRTSLANYDNGTNRAALVETKLRIPHASSPGMSILYYGFSNSPSSSGSAWAVWMVREAAVPEPATWAMMIAGFGLAGAVVRRNRRRDARHA